jgi:four helix bundle protein
MMDKYELQRRTKQFGLRVIRLVEALPHTQTGRVIGNQLLRSATSVGANYRAACRGRSKAEFAAKVGIAIEEADESLFGWKCSLNLIWFPKPA